MKNSIEWKKVLLLGMVAPLLCAGDWPRWRGPDGTGHVPAGTASLSSLPEGPKPLWRIPVGHGLASPVVSGERVFHMDNQNGKETAHAVDTATGRTLWSVPLDDVFKDNHSEPGPRCAPTVDGDRVYVQSCRGEFRCLDVEDGKTRWRVNFVRDFDALFFGETGPAIGASRHGYTGAPVVDGNRIFVGVGGTNGASIVCFDKQDGQVIWKSQNDVSGYAGPVLADLAGIKQVVAFTAEAVIGLRAEDGELLWRVPIKTSFGRHIITPVITGNLVIVSSHQAGLIGIRVEREGTSIKAEHAWVSRPATINCSNPVLVGHHLFGLGRSRTLMCVDVRTGEVAWTEKRFTPKPLHRDYTAFLVFGNRVLALADNGCLVLFEADPTGFRPVGKIEVCGRTWCHPAFADGRLYLRDEHKLMCIPLNP